MKFDAPNVLTAAKSKLSIRLLIRDNLGETSNDTVNIVLLNLNEDNYSFLTKWGAYGSGNGTFQFLKKA